MEPLESSTITCKKCGHTQRFPNDADAEAARVLACPKCGTAANYRKKVSRRLSDALTSIGDLTGGGDDIPWRSVIVVAILAAIAAAIGFAISPNRVEGAALGATVVVVVVVQTIRTLEGVQQTVRAFRRIEKAETVAEKEPERAKPAWDVARVTLEAYFARNLRQINLIFGLSVFVMLVGFGVMIFGVIRAITSTNFPAALLATAAGTVTQFIGGTFLIVYRSAISQAIGYTSTLERMNSVGMALQILDTMDKENERDLTNATKAELVKLLVRQVPQDDART